MVTPFSVRKLANSYLRDDEFNIRLQPLIFLAQQGKYTLNPFFVEHVEIAKNNSSNSTYIC